MTEDTNDSQMPFVEDTVLPAANTVYLNQQDKERLTVDIDGYEGPLDVLLSLARVQKVDLKQISILELAEQYLVFIKDAHDLKIELAADYLVMASWLAYLKSRLLLPANEDEEELSAEDMANRLVFQLQKLESMREASIQLMNRPQLGKDMFKRGNPEGIRIKRHSQYHASLYDLLGSYSTQRLRNYYSNWKPKELDVFTIERARQRLEHMLGKLDDWDKFDTLVLKNIQSAQKRRTMTASSLSAILEFVRDGRMEIHQDKNFGEILVRRARPKTATI
ncbi:MAG: segregation and condensation protein A [Parvibaculales bacterium]